MKLHLICILILNTTTHLSFAQSWPTQNRPVAPGTQAIRWVPKAEELVSNRVIKLNGIGRGLLGGNSRQSVIVVLPRNTIEWYYSFTTSSDATFNNQLKLAAQIGSALLVFTAGGPVFAGLANEVIQRINVPAGSMPINSYVFLAQNINNFMNNGIGGYFPGTEMQGTMSGKMPIRHLRPEVYYIGLMNNSTFKAVNVSIEVVAIVMTPAP